MRPLDQETNIAIVKSYAKAIEHRLLEAEKVISSLQGQIFEERQIKISVADQLSRLEKKFFGFGRETRKSRPIGHKDEELRLHTEHFPEFNIEDAKPLEKTLDEPLIVTYPVLAKEMAEENSLRAIETGIADDPWSEMKNFYQESTEITVTERTYQKVIHRQKKYRLKDEYNTEYRSL